MELRRGLARARARVLELPQAQAPERALARARAWAQVLALEPARKLCGVAGRG